MTTKIPPRTWIAFMGLPTFGKSTTAAILSLITDVPVVDIDDQARTPVLGKPPANDGTDPAIAKQDQLEMGIAYDILFAMGEGAMRAGKSIITTCTLSSRKWGQTRLAEIRDRQPGMRLKVIWCNAQMTDHELDARIAQRMASGYTGATRSAERVRQLAAKFEPPDPTLLSFIEIDTGTDDPETCADKALEFILQD